MIYDVNINFDNIRRAGKFFKGNLSKKTTTKPDRLPFFSWKMERTCIVELPLLFSLFKANILW